MRWSGILLSGLCAISFSEVCAGEVIAARPLPKGEVLTSDMLTASAAADLTPLIGQQLRRPIFEGRVVSIADVEQPDLVERQSQVTVQFRRAGLLLSIQGRAMRSGGLGEQIPVLIEKRRQPFTATVIGHGLVEIGS